MAGAAPLPALLAGSHFILIGAVAFGIIALLGYIVHRTTLYTITSKRVVMRFGMALPMTFNIPFTQIAAADVKLFCEWRGRCRLHTQERFAGDVRAPVAARARPRASHIPSPHCVASPMPSASAIS